MSGSKWFLEKDDKFENTISRISGEYEDQEAAMKAARDLILAEQSLGDLPAHHFAYLGKENVPEYYKDCLVVVGPNNVRIRVVPEIH